MIETGNGITWTGDRFLDGWILLTWIFIEILPYLIGFIIGYLTNKFVKRDK